MFEIQSFELAKLRYEQLLQEAEDYRQARRLRPDHVRPLLQRFMRYLAIGSANVLRNRYSMSVLSAMGMKLRAS
jgi:hypothetical protein